MEGMPSGAIAGRRRSAVVRYLGVFLFVWTHLTGVGGLKNVRVVSPGAVAVGETVMLECQYDLEGAELYAVKWYKGKKEFYRFLPKEDPPTKVFPLPGINVDLSESDAHHVVLRDAGFSLTGRYRCEVSADAPSFDTALVAASLVIVDEGDEGMSDGGEEEDVGIKVVKEGMIEEEEQEKGDGRKGEDVAVMVDEIGGKGRFLSGIQEEGDNTIGEEWEWEKMKNNGAMRYADEGSALGNNFEEEEAVAEEWDDENNYEIYANGEESIGTGHEAEAIAITNEDDNDDEIEYVSMEDKNENHAQPYGFKAQHLTEVNDEQVVECDGYLEEVCDSDSEEVDQIGEVVPEYQPKNTIFPYNNGNMGTFSGKTPKSDERMELDEKEDSENYNEVVYGEIDHVKEGHRTSNEEDEDSGGILYDDGEDDDEFFLEEDANEDEEFISVGDDSENLEIGEESPKEDSDDDFAEKYKEDTRILSVDQDLSEKHEEDHLEQNGALLSVNEKIFVEYEPQECPLQHLCNHHEDEVGEIGLSDPNHSEKLYVNTQTNFGAENSAVLDATGNAEEAIESSREEDRNTINGNSEGHVNVALLKQTLSNILRQTDCCLIKDGINKEIKHGMDSVDLEFKKKRCEEDLRDCLERCIDDYFRKQKPEEWNHVFEDFTNENHEYGYSDGINKSEERDICDASKSANIHECEEEQNDSYVNGEVYEEEITNGNKNDDQVEREDNEVQMYEDDFEEGREDEEEDDVVNNNDEKDAHISEFLKENVEVEFEEEPKNDDTYLYVEDSAAKENDFIDEENDEIIIVEDNSISDDDANNMDHFLGDDFDGLLYESDEVSIGNKCEDRKLSGKEICNADAECKNNEAVSSKDKNKYEENADENICKDVTFQAAEEDLYENDEEDSIQNVDFDLDVTAGVVVDAGVDVDLDAFVVDRDGLDVGYNPLVDADVETHKYMDSVHNFFGNVKEEKRRYYQDENRHEPMDDENVYDDVYEVTNMGTHENSEELGDAEEENENNDIKYEEHTIRDTDVSQEKYVGETGTEESDKYASKGTLNDNNVIFEDELGYENNLLEREDVSFPNNGRRGKESIDDVTSRGEDSDTFEDLDDDVDLTVDPNCNYCYYTDENINADATIEENVDTFEGIDKAASDITDANSTVDSNCITCYYADENGDECVDTVEDDSECIRVEEDLDVGQETNDNIPADTSDHVDCVEDTCRTIYKSIDVDLDEVEDTDADLDEDVDEYEDLDLDEGFYGAEDPFVVKHSNYADTYDAENENRNNNVDVIAKLDKNVFQDMEVVKGFYEQCNKVSESGVNECMFNINEDDGENVHTYKGNGDGECLDKHVCKDDCSAVTADVDESLPYLLENVADENEGANDNLYEDVDIYEDNNESDEIYNQKTINHNDNDENHNDGPGDLSNEENSKVIDGHADEEFIPFNLNLSSVKNHKEINFAEDVYEYVDEDVDYEGDNYRYYN